MTKSSLLNAPRFYSFFLNFLFSLSLALFTVTPTKTQKLRKLKGICTDQLFFFILSTKHFWAQLWISNIKTHAEEARDTPQVQPDWITKSNKNWSDVVNCWLSFFKLVGQFTVGRLRTRFNNVYHDKSSLIRPVGNRHPKSAKMYFHFRWLTDFSHISFFIAFAWTVHRLRSRLGKIITVNDWIGLFTLNFSSLSIKQKLRSKVFGTVSRNPVSAS